MSDTRSQGSPNVPNWPQMSLNQSKWSKMILNKPKWPQMSLKQPQSGQSFVKYLPMMHGSERDFVNFMAFFGCFLDAPPPTQSLTPSFFGIWKVFRWYISGSSFIYAWVVVPKFSNFKCFHSRRKFDFRLLLGGFLYVTSWNVVKFIWYFEQWCNAK